MSLATDFLSLFDGNPAAVGTNEGGCLRRPDVGGDEWWGAQVLSHLTGEGQPIGVYPIHDGVVSWGCIDYDDGDVSYEQALNTQRLLVRFGVTSWIEVSRSKGHHLWVFAARPVPAIVMREALVASQQMLGIPPREVNPKQTELAPDQLGNYVRLPYPGALGPLHDFNLQGGRQVMLGVDGEPTPFGEFVEAAYQSRVDPEHLGALRDRYQAPPEPIEVGPSPGITRDLLNRLDGLPYTIWRMGPSQGSDRSTQLARLAYRIAANSTPIKPEEALALLADADRRWGKYHDRPDGVEILSDLVGRAYAR